MSWNLEGCRVNGLYMGLFPFSGNVVESRVKYGGTLQHTVVVDEPFVVCGAVRDHILFDEVELNRVSCGARVWVETEHPVEIVR